MEQSKIIDTTETYTDTYTLSLHDALPISIIFDCSMLYYLLFWTLLGFIIHFYIIFGTNLLTGGPAQNCCFCLF